MSTPVLTFRTMITMSIIAVKDPMMMPMTSDIVGDIPLSDSILGFSASSSSFYIIHLNLYLKIPFFTFCASNSDPSGILYFSSYPLTVLSPLSPPDADG